MPLYGLHNKLTAQPGKREILEDILIRASGLTMASPDCHLYMVSRDISDVNTIWVTEVWESQEAHSASLRKPEVLALISEAMSIIAGMPQKGQELEIVGGFNS